MAINPYPDSSNYLVDINKQKQIVRMFRDGLPIDQIAKLTLVPLKKIERLCECIALTQDEQKHRNEMLFNYQESSQSELIGKRKERLNTVTNLLSSISSDYTNTIKSGFSKVKEYMDSLTVEHPSDLKSLTGVMKDVSDLHDRFYTLVAKGDADLLKEIADSLIMEQTIEVITRTEQTKTDENGLVLLDKKGERDTSTQVEEKSESRKITFGKK